MKKILAALLAVSLLFLSCGRHIPTSRLPYTNSENGCTLGDRYYSSFYPNTVTVYSPDGARQGLCTDPLCLHDGTDGICPDYTRHHLRTIVTDGEKLYMSVFATELTDNGILYQQIYSLNPDGSDFRLLATVEMGGSDSPFLKVGGGYLWFPQSRYDENAAEGEQEYIVILRIPADGGEPEIALDERYFNGVSYAVRADGGEAAVLRYSKTGSIADPRSSDGEWAEITDLVTGEKTVVPPPAPDESMTQLTYFEDTLWLECMRDHTVTYTRDSGEEGSQNRTDMVLYRLEGDRFVYVTESPEPMVYGADAIWYVRYDCEYLGTKPMPTGRAGEKVDFDFVVPANTVIGCVRNGEVAERAPGEGFLPEEGLSVMMAADGILYGIVRNDRMYYETGKVHAETCLLNPETLDVVRRFEEGMR